MDKAMKISFMEAFNRVFDRDGIMKKCLTSDTMELVNICRQIDPKGEFCARDPYEFWITPVLVLHREILRHDLKEAYKAVFDENGKIKNCGREKCMDLISMCNKINPLGEGLYGNKQNGIINVEAIKMLKKRYLKEEEV